MPTHNIEGYISADVDVPPRIEGILHWPLGNSQTYKVYECVLEYCNTRKTLAERKHPNNNYNIYNHESQTS